MYKTRTTNVNAAQWSPNGGAMGTLDLTEPANQVFGANVFGPAQQKARLPKTVYKELQSGVRAGGAAGPVAGRRGRRRHEGLGAGAGRDALHALVPAAD